MKRGFLNTPRAKRMIEEVYTPRSPPGPESARQGRPPSPRLMQEDGGRAAVAEDEVEMETTAAGDLSNARDRVVGACTTQSTEGKAELPSLDKDNDASTSAEPPQKDAEGEEKEKVVDAHDDAMDAPPDVDDPSFSSLPPRPPPGRPGWGRDPDEDFFHTVPRSHGGPEKRRAVFRLWPRDPNGKMLMPSEWPRGTLSPDGYPWGATLYDFYTVGRSPKSHAMSAIMTGSALREAMEELGELDAAGPEIEWAKSEGRPRVAGVADTQVLIEDIEAASCLRTFHNFLTLDEMRKTVSEHDSEAEDESEVDDDDTEVDPASIPPPPTIPVTSLSHPSHCLPPWPFIPFENPLSILLQERIPSHLLPQTLYVHDPFNLLSAHERRFHDTSWKSRPDIVRTYNLTLSHSVREEAKEGMRKAEELEEFKARTLIIMRYKRTKEQIKNYEPVIEVPLPPYQRRMTKVEESHLYLSPIGKVGKGHHSIVYKAEWELPRDLFTRPKICPQCFKESMDKEIQRLKDTGRWEKMLRAAGWGPTGLTKHEPTEAELNEINDPTNLERDGEIIEREITCVVPPNALPSQVFEIIEESNVWNVLMKERDANVIGLNFAGGEDEDELTRASDVATIRIDPPFSYESQKSCAHDLLRFPIPRTTRFTITAKLSIENDHHLTREAGNYQQFPERFFHHFNGYTFVGQLHAIVPVNAVVPQFYGFYTPKNQGWESYLSPILLLEHCGEPIDPQKLSREDQAECASLLLRFQRAGWLHESVAPRNFLVQSGKPTEFPSTRQSNPEPSFRLIDFGRSRKFEEVSEKREEELEALRMFHKLQGRMKVTLFDLMG